MRYILTEIYEIYEPSAEKMSMHPVFQKCRLSNFYLDFEELSFFTYSDISKKSATGTFSWPMANITI